MDKDPYETILDDYRSRKVSVTIHRQESLAVKGTVIEIKEGGCLIHEDAGTNIFIAFRNISGVRTAPD